MKKLGKFFLNGILLTTCSVLMRTVAVSFNIYVAQKAGAEAMGLYSLLTGIYGFALTMALSGLHLAVTKLVAEALALDHRAAALKIVRHALFYAALFGVAAMTLLHFSAELIAERWLHDLRAQRPLKLLSLTLPLISASSVINGYFSAVRRVYKSALSQALEMSIKILATVLLFQRVLLRNAETVCLLLVGGSAMAELCVFVINLVLWLFDKVRHLKPTDARLWTGSVDRKILGISLPVALASYVRSALISVEHAMIPSGLIKKGLSYKDSLSQYGTVAGMALPVINFPYALIGSFAALLIPEVAESRAKKENRHLTYITYRTYQFCLVLSLCLCGIFLLFGRMLGRILYDSEEAGRYIRALALLVPVMYLDTATDSILKGLGEQLYCMKVNIADACLSVFLVFLCVPRAGIAGYILAIYITEIFNASLSIARVFRLLPARIPIGKFILAPVLSALGAGAIVQIPLFLQISLKEESVCLSGILLFLALYFLLARLTGAFSKEDMKWLKTVFSRTPPH